MFVITPTHNHHIKLVSFIYYIDYLVSLFPPFIHKPSNSTSYQSDTVLHGLSHHYSTAKFPIAKIKNSDQSPLLVVSSFRQPPPFFVAIRYCSGDFSGRQPHHQNHPPPDLSNTTGISLILHPTLPHALVLHCGVHRKFFSLASHPAPFPAAVWCALPIHPLFGSGLTSLNDTVLSHPFAETF